MKGQTNEIINLTILIIIISVIFLISYFITLKPQRATEEFLIKENKYALVSNVVNEFYYSKPLGADISYSQLLGYRIVLNKNPIYFGEIYFYVDVDQMITDFFNKYFDDNWYFEVSYKNQDIILGNKKQVGSQAIEILIPLPKNNNIVKGYLHVWSN